MYTKIQANAVNITKPINVYSIYIYSQDLINEIKLSRLIEEILKPYLLLGDLNTQNAI